MRPFLLHFVVFALAISIATGATPICFASELPSAEKTAPGTAAATKPVVPPTATPSQENPTTSDVPNVEAKQENVVEIKEPSKTVLARRATDPATVKRSLFQKISDFFTCKSCRQAPEPVVPAARVVTCGDGAVVDGSYWEAEQVQASAKATTPSKPRYTPSGEPGVAGPTNDGRGRGLLEDTQSDPKAAAKPEAEQKKPGALKKILGTTKDVFTLKKLREKNKNKKNKGTPASQDGEDVNAKKETGTPEKRRRLASKKGEQAVEEDVSKQDKKPGALKKILGTTKDVFTLKKLREKNKNKKNKGTPASQDGEDVNAKKETGTPEKRRRLASKKGEQAVEEDVSKQDKKPGGVKKFFGKTKDVLTLKKLRHKKADGKEEMEKEKPHVEPEGKEEKDKRTAAPAA
eukprot:GHVT01005014.1.p1 GENE.GHVT01005014.1~~GHVT01005014.1.p1  ORF type:complete len:404 (+),score=90.49 GHVT01005014.1:178-1389(+)